MNKADNNYMLLQQRNVRIPLLAKNGIWKFTLNKEKWEIPDCMERLYAYHLIGCQSPSMTSNTLRANYRNITPIQIEAFIRHFEKTHPVEEYPFDINEVPVYATEKSPLYIPNCFGYDVLFTKEQEQEILEIIKNNPENVYRERIIRWFDEYIARYDLRPQRNYDDIDLCYGLIENFYQTHGLDYEAIYGQEAMEKEYLKGWGITGIVTIVGVIAMLYFLLCSIWDKWLFFN